MKKKTQKTIPVIEQDSPHIPGATAVPFKSIESITAEFIAALKKKSKNQGENSYIDDLALSLNMIVHNYRDQTWSVNTAIELTRHLDTPVSALMPLFFEWVEELKKYKRVQQMLSVYNFHMWSFK
jgi:hypothetical protein